MTYLNLLQCNVSWIVCYSQRLGKRSSRSMACPKLVSLHLAMRVEQSVLPPITVTVALQHRFASCCITYMRLAK
jgi:hypothetical protein